MSIEVALNKIKNELPNGVVLVAVSKTKPIEVLMKAYDAGQRVFGENKIQEMEAKYQLMPKDIEWHMIGHVQRNKVKYMAPFVKLIHAVDSLKLLVEINKEAKKNNRVIKCLLQLKIASEESKYGMTEKSITDLLASDEVTELENIKIVGLMGMATFTSNETQLVKEFQKMKIFFDSIKNAYNLSILSMGMSNDYTLAIKNGSSMIRVGSAIFGARSYT